MHAKHNSSHQRPLWQHCLLLGLLAYCCTAAVSAQVKSGVGAGSGKPALPLGRHLLIVLLDDAPPLSCFDDWIGFPENSLPGVSSQSALYPRTPVLDGLAAQGVRLYSMRTAPVCSPTRASLLTGRHAFRHGLGTVVNAETDGPVGAGGLAEFGDGGYAAPTLLQVLEAQGIRTALIGKLHLSAWTNQSFAHNPGRFGSGWEILPRVVAPETFLSTQLRNLNQLPVPGGGAAFEGGYYNFFANPGRLNSALMARKDYATSWQVDRTIEFFQSLRSAQRGFCLLSLNACHSPYGRPGSPPDLTRDLPPPGLSTTAEYADKVAQAEQASLDTTWPQYMASMEAADSELGRLLASLSPRVRAGLSILVLSDNGFEPALADGRATWGKDFGPDWESFLQSYGTSRLKGSVYHWGSSSPAIWSGPGRRTRNLPTAGSASTALVDVVDVAATAADYFGLSFPASDGRSFLPVIYEGTSPALHARRATLAEEFWPSGDWRAIQTGDGPAEHLERGYQRYFLDAECVNGFGGRYSLVRHFAGGAWHDELYRLTNEAGVPLDLFERTDLLPLGGHQEQLQRMLLELQSLLASSL